VTRRTQNTPSRLQSATAAKKVTASAEAIASEKENAKLTSTSNKSRFGRKRALSEKMLATKKTGDFDGEDESITPPPKKIKVVTDDVVEGDGASLKIFVNFDEGFKDDYIEPFMCKPACYGAMLMYSGDSPLTEDVKRFNDAWVILKKLNPASCADLSSSWARGCLLRFNCRSMEKGQV
jgi:hypothetical protein